MRFPTARFWKRSRIAIWSVDLLFISAITLVFTALELYLRPFNLAGGGVRGGYDQGSTDDFGFKAEDKPMQVHDLHATILHLPGIDHERLTFRHAGRDFRLTDICGKAAHDILT